MSMYRFDPGDLFSCVDIYATEYTVFGVVLHDKAALVIRSDRATSGFAMQRTRMPHAAIPMSADSPPMPSEIRLALEAVIVAMSLQHRPE